MKCRHTWVGWDRVHCLPSQMFARLRTQNPWPYPLHFPIESASQNPTAFGHGQSPQRSLQRTPANRTRQATSQVHFAANGRLSEERRSPADQRAEILAILQDIGPRNTVLVQK